MINASNIYIKYGNRVLLDGVNLVVREKDKLGLVGRNGAGKSTMLKVIAGDMIPQEGTITRPNETTLGFLHQEMDLPKGKTVLDETMTAFEQVRSLEREMEKINHEMATRTDYDSDAYTKLVQDFSDMNERFLVLGGDSMEAETEKVLKGLGFKQTDFQRLTDEFSGGWQMRIELAKMLLQRPNYLLLDEPTNHLDIESIIWLENFLKYYSGAVIIISHDKQFLDNITKRTVEVDMGNLFDYKASYSKYVQLRAERREKLQSAFDNQQKVIAQREQTINRFMAKATKTKMAQSMKKQLDKMERIELDAENTSSMRLRFPPAPRAGEVVLDARRMAKRYDKLLVLDDVDIQLNRGERVAFVGQNGQGKTTLAKIIVGTIAATGGNMELGHNVQIGYYAQNQSDTLQSNLTLLETMEQHSPPEMQTKLRKILGSFMFSGDDVTKKVSVLSGGERARLALACLLLRPFNLLVLDEPTNHLDMISKEVLKNALINYDGTLIVVSHDRDFLADLTTKTIEFRDKQLYTHLGDVNYFLQRRELDNMRDVELKDKKKAAEEKPKSTLSYEERKRLQRAVSNAEKKVKRLGEEIKKQEKIMADPSFYEQADAQTVIKKHQDLKADLEKAEEAWLEAQMVLEEAV